MAQKQIPFFFTDFNVTTLSGMSYKSRVKASETYNRKCTSYIMSKKITGFLPISIYNTLYYWKKHFLMIVIFKNEEKGVNI